MAALSVVAGALNVALFTGRIHLYEDFRPDQAVHTVRTAVLTGARTVVLTNACGAMGQGQILPRGHPT